MSIKRKILMRISSNSFSQKILEKIVQISEFYMGIGSSADVYSSGEKVVFDVLSNSAPPLCIFDVGSNKGQFLDLTLKNILTDDFTIHCFEPASTTFQVLLQNSRKDRRIKLNNIGLGKERYETSLYYDSLGSGLASLTKRKLDHYNIDFSKFERVKIDTIDNYCRENSIDRIHLLKIDVEGHELDVLDGASEMFERKAIDIVAFEFGGCNIDTRSFFQDFYYFFQNVNMKIFRIAPSGYLCPINSYTELCEKFRTTNFLTIKNA